MYYFQVRDYPVRHHILASHVSVRCTVARVPSWVSDSIKHRAATCVRHIKSHFSKGSRKPQEVAAAAAISTPMPAAAQAAFIQSAIASAGLI